MYPLPPEPPLDPPEDDEILENRRVRYQRHLADQAEEDYWYSQHGNSDDE